MFKGSCAGINCLAILTALVLMFARLNYSARVGDRTKGPQPLTEACLQCLCEAKSGCNATAVCVNGACGIFRITWAFWVDAGRLTYGNGTSLDQDAFTDCVNNPYCAAETTQAYMAKYGQDCNGDGVINCYDYAALHKLGYINCFRDQPYVYEKFFRDCLETFERQAEEGVPLKI